MKESLGKLPGRSLLKRALHGCFSPLLRQYTVTRASHHFPDRNTALQLLEPLMQTDPEAADYHRYHLTRYLKTLEYLADLPRHTRVLEIGAPPYGITVLMRQWLFDQVTVTGYDEKASDQLVKTTEREVLIKSREGQILFEGRERRFNAELHRWPYPDGEFDLVVACETFEHLGLDPMHAYCEANRVLKTGGRLFLTVPNGLALSNGIRFLLGEQPNSFPFYRPEGYSLRHLREPTPREVTTLLRAAGFEPEFVETANFSPPTIRGLLRTIGLCVLVARLDHHREMLIARGVKRTAPQERYPTDENLYFGWDVEKFRRRPPNPV